VTEFSTPDNPDRPLRESLLTELETLQSVCRDVVSTVSPRSLGARELARRLAVNKMMGWRLFLLAYESDLMKVLRNLPGRTSWSRVLGGLQAGGAGEITCRRLEVAIEDFERFVAEAGLPRQSLVSLVGNPVKELGVANEALRLRRLAFESERITDGRSLRARIGAYLLTRSPSRPDHAAIAAATILDGPMIAPDQSPRAFYVTVNSLAKTTSVDQDEPGSAFVKDLSTPGITRDELQAAPHRGRTRFVLAPASALRLSPLHLAFLERSEFTGPLHRTRGGDASKEETADMCMPLDVPTERVVFDLLLHRDLPIGGEPISTVLLDRPPQDHGPVKSTRTARTPFKRATLPSPDLPEDWNLPNRDYLALLDRAAGLLSTRLSDFTIRRLTMTYPPIRGMALHRWPLAEPN
jgi:hypothetical protein